MLRFRHFIVIFLIIGIFHTFLIATVSADTTTRQQKFASRITRIQQKLASVDATHPKKKAKLEKRLERVQTRYATWLAKPKSYCRVYHLTEQQCIDAWITRNNLNEFGDPKETMYGGGTPLFDEATGSYIDRYSYIKSHHPKSPWWSMV